VQADFRKEIVECGSGSGIFYNFGSGSRIQFQIQDFGDQKLKKIYSWNFCLTFFFYQKLQFTYPWTSLKDAQATGEAFNPQKRTSGT
jgi:hypothetical protein